MRTFQPDLEIGDAELEEMVTSGVDVFLASYGPG